MQIFHYYAISRSKLLYQGKNLILALLHGKRAREYMQQMVWLWALVRSQARIKTCRTSTSSAYQVPFRAISLGFPKSLKQRAITSPGPFSKPIHAIVRAE